MHAVATDGACSGGEYDVLINNARVVDGTGNPWYKGSVATRGDRIVYVGPSLEGQTAKRVIDAEGLVCFARIHRHARPLGVLAPPWTACDFQNLTGNHE